MTIVTANCTLTIFLMEHLAGAVNVAQRFFLRVFGEVGKALGLIRSSLQFQLSSQEAPAVRLSICAFAVLITLLGASQTMAQDTDPKSRVEIKMMVGASDFGFEESYPHLLVGAATRIRISRHWSVEPEFNYMRRHSNDEDFLFQPNVVYEFYPRGTRVVPYLIGGVGYVRHKSVFNGSNSVTGAPITYDSSYRTWSASAGGGLKIFISKHLFVAPEARVGREPTARATVSIGYVFPVND